MNVYAEKQTSSRRNYENEPREEVAKTATETNIVLGKKPPLYGCLLFLSPRFISLCAFFIFLREFGCASLFVSVISFNETEEHVKQYWCRGSILSPTFNHLHHLKPFTLSTIHFDVHFLNKLLLSLVRLSARNPWDLNS